LTWYRPPENSDGNDGFVLLKSIYTPRLQSAASTKAPRLYGSGGALRRHHHAILCTAGHRGSGDASPRISIAPGGLQPQSLCSGLFGSVGPSMQGMALRYS